MDTGDNLIVSSETESALTGAPINYPQRYLYECEIVSSFARIIVFIIFITLNQIQKLLSIEFFLLLRPNRLS